MATHVALCCFKLKKVCMCHTYDQKSLNSQSSLLHCPQSQTPFPQSNCHGQRGFLAPYGLKVFCSFFEREHSVLLYRQSEGWVGPLGRTLLLACPYVTFESLDLVSCVKKYILTVTFQLVQSKLLKISTINHNKAPWVQ